MQRTAYMTQEEFEMYANLAVTLDRHLAETNKELKRYEGPRGAVLATVEEGYRLETLAAEAISLRNQICELAAEMADAGVPLAVWIRVKREGEPDAKVKVTVGSKNGAGREYILAVEEVR